MLPATPALLIFVVMRSLSEPVCSKAGVEQAPQVAGAMPHRICRRCEVLVGLMRSRDFQGIVYTQAVQLSSFIHASVAVLCACRFFAQGCPSEVDASV